MPRIKRIVPVGYTTVNNDFLRDTEMSLAARGLLITMLSLPDGWNMSGRGLAAILPDGRDKVFSTLKSLEKKGYLKREKIRENGQFVDVEYQFCDMPIFYKENNEKKVSETKSSSQKKTMSRKTPDKDLRETTENVSTCFSNISPRDESDEDVLKNLNSLAGEKLEEYVEKKVLEKEKCITEFHIPETHVNHIIDIFINSCITKPELRKKLSAFTFMDIVDLYNRIKKYKKTDEKIKKFFETETPFWKKAQ